MKKNILFLLPLGVLSICLGSCKDYTIGQQAMDDIAPGPVSNVKVFNTPGGATITYSLPADEDLSYVKAEYLRNDSSGIVVTKSSVYNDTLRLEGFSNTEPRSVTLYAVDNSGNISEGVKTEVTPQTPPYLSIAQTLNIVEDYGGIDASWTNSLQKEVTINIDTINTNGEWQQAAIFYTAALQGSGSLYGQQNKTKKFRSYVKDRWGNISPYVIKEMTPWYEQEFQKSKFSEAFLPSDEQSHFSNWVLSHVWDGIYNADQGYSTNTSGIWPQSFTFNLGVTGCISRIRLFQRNAWWAWKAATPRIFEVWGCTTDKYSDDWNNWTLLGTLESHRPSGLPYGTAPTDEDLDVAITSGENFKIPYESSKIPVHYLRIKVLKTWGDAHNFCFAELFIYGNYRDYNN
jgi:hypothetical protein